MFYNAGIRKNGMFLINRIRTAAFPSAYDCEITSAFSIHL